MPLETASYPTDLVSSNPSSTDPTNQGDDHLRLLKSVLKTTLAGVNAAATRVIGASFGFLAGPGSSTNPSYSFSSNAGLGTWDAGSNTLGLGPHIAVVGTASANILNSATSVNGATGNFSGACTAGAFSTSGAINGGTGSFSGAVSAASFVGAIPAGFIMDFAGPVAPAGWVACDGFEISRTTFSQLFARIGTTWGGGNGTSTFNIPYLPRRYRRHRDTVDTSLAGAVGTYQNPTNLAHAHTYSGTSSDQSNGHTHTYSGTSSDQSNGHTHTYGGTSSDQSNGHTHTYGGTSSGQSVGHTHTYSSTTGSTNTDHSHGVNINSGGMSANTSHTHALGGPQSAFLTSINNGTAASQGNVVVTSGGLSANLTTSSVNIDHGHNVNGNTGAMSANAAHTHSVGGTTDGGNVDHTHNYSGTSDAGNVGHTHTYGGTTSAVSGGHTHTYSGTSAAGDVGHTHTYGGTSASSGDANESRPFSATVLTCIKLFD